MAHNVDVDIRARIDPAALDRSAQKARDSMLRWGRNTGHEVGVEFSRSAKLDPKPPNTAKYAAAGARDGRAYGRAFNRASKLKSPLTELTKGLGELTSAAGSFAMAGLPVALLGVAGAAATATGAIALLPAALDGAIAGVGTLVIGLHGFDKALTDMGDAKKFAKDIQSLSPAAQQAALEIQHLVQGPWGALKKATQESLFSGLATEIDQLSTKFTPAIQQMTTGIAGSFNTITHNIGEQLMTPETSAAITSTLSNITSAFQNLAPAAAPFTKAMGDLAQVGSTFLPGFAQSISDAAVKFSQFIQNASQTGQLRQWIEDGVTACKELFNIAKDVGEAFMALAPIGRDVLPPLEGILHDIADALKEHPGLIWAVVGAFGAWKAIEGTAALITSLTTISTALGALPAQAATAGAGIAAGLGPAIAAAATLAGTLAAGYAQANANERLLNSHQAITPIPMETNGTAGTLPGAGMDPLGIGKMQQDSRNAHPQFSIPGPDKHNLAARRQGLPGGPPMAPAAPGWDEFLPKPGTSFAVPAAPAEGGKGGKGIKLPTVAGSGADPMSLLQGYAVTSALYGAARSVLDDQQRVAQAQSDLNTLLKSNTATADEITQKRNELAHAEQEEHQAELHLNEEKQKASGKHLKSMKDATSAFDEIGAHLDKDLGLSKGLPGLADNLVRFIAALATAPLQGLLAPIAGQAPKGQSGLFGMAAANGAFGQQFMPQGAEGYANYTPMSPVSGGKAGTAQQIYSSFLANGYSPESAKAVVEAGLLESGLNPTITNSSGHNSIFQTSADKGVPSTVPDQVNWALGEAQRNGGPAAMNASDPRAWWANHVERGGYPGSNYSQFGPQADQLLGPMMGGGGRGMGMPSGLPISAPASAATPQSDLLTNGVPQAQPGWQPNGGGVGFGGGLIGAAIQSGASAFGGPGGGAAAQMAMQLIGEGVKFSGKLAGIGAEGVADTLFPSDPDSGANPIKSSWLWRAAGALAGAAPAIGSGGAGQADKQAEKARQQQQGDQQGHTIHGDVHTGPNVYVTSPNDQSGKGMGIDIAHMLNNQSAAAAQPPVGAFGNT